MNSIAPSVGAFSKEEIHQQLQRIITDRIFADSEILQKFLFFIAQETQEGRSNQLKEYTIGLNVLQKPINFDPRLDAIVRIHACRLRRALHNYYQLPGAEDPIHIAMPKGGYILVFSDNRLKRGSENADHRDKEIMSEFEAIDVVKNLLRADMKYCDDRIMITVRMLNIETNDEIWSQVIEYKVSNSHGWGIQEDISRKLMAIVGEYCKFIEENVARSSRIAVA